MKIIVIYAIVCLPELIPSKLDCSLLINTVHLFVHAYLGHTVQPCAYSWRACLALPCLASMVAHVCNRTRIAEERKDQKEKRRLFAFQH